jgi:protein ImuB
VTLAEKLAERQGDLEKPINAETSAEQQAQLIDALKQRLGHEAVRRLCPVESHIPERAEVSQKADGPASAWTEAYADRWRPPLLLPQPEEAEVTALIPDGPPRQFRWRGETHAIASAQGPERIADEWWRGDANGLTRDYYCLENKAGQRFWLYREGLYGRETGSPRWFVHGFFA